MENASDTGKGELVERMLQLSTAYIDARAVWVVAKLGIPDLLAEGPRSVADLAGACSADPSALLRVLRLAAANGTLEEAGPGSQFETADHRLPDEVIRSICEQGYLPSFCTACYRVGRTGKDFMDIAKPGDIQHLCGPNAVLTFKEYLLDYAPAETREVGEIALKQHLEDISNQSMKEKTRERLEEMEKGKRDLYF